VMEHVTEKLVEGHQRFCRECGHDLLGFSDSVCPRCGRSNVLVTARRPHRRRPQNAVGRWVVLVLVLVGTVTALVALRFRNLPRPGATTRPAGATQPTTAPAMPQLPGG
jgi:ribosomal protein S27AE